MRDNRKLTIEKLKEYFVRYLQGESILSISSELNMRPNTLTCKFKNAGLIKSSRSPHAHLPLQDIYNEHVSGVPYKELAKNYNVNPKNPRRLLKAGGYPSDKDKVVRTDLVLAP